MLWQKASARTVPTTSPGSAGPSSASPGSRSQRKSSSSRMVVAPSRFLQYAAKSCSPTSSRAAAFISSTSNSRSCHSTWLRRSGSTPAWVSHTRYA